MAAVAVDEGAEPSGGGVVTARFPSAQFPGPPGVAVDVPASWAPLTPAAFLLLDARIDLAVVGPAEVDGVRPSLIVSLSRTLPTADPEPLLAAVATTFGPAQQPVAAGSFAPAVGVGPHLSHAVGYDERDGGRLVRRHRLTVYVHGDTMAHVVSVVGSAAAGDPAGRDEVVAMLRSLRIVAPWAASGSASASASGEAGGAGR